MKQLIFIGLLLLCFVFKSRAQNLVPNWSFEDNIDCSSASINNSPPWCPVGKYSALHLYKCQSDPFGTTPFQYIDNCFQSYQVPRTGQAYCVIGIYNTSSTANFDCFTQIKLQDTLKLNKTYCITFYVSLWNYCKFSFDKLGARLSSSSLLCIVAGTNTMAIAGLYAPQIVSPAGIQLDDTLNWMEVSGNYTSNGSELYLTIGDFFLQSQHSIVNSYPTNCNAVADYYIDDVSVEEVQIAKTKNDTLIYAGDSTIIGNNASEAALFSWQPTTGLSCTNCPNPKASPSVTTTYTVTKTQCKAITNDVITITVSPTGIAEAEALEAGVKLQPNPTNGLIIINSRFEMQRIDVMNIAGQLLLSQSTTEKNHQLNLTDFSDGIYFVRVVYNNGLSATKKVVKQ